MRALRWIAPALLALSLFPAAAAADPIAAHDEAEANRRVHRQEIARILAADNLDAERLSSREIATAIRAIPRGQAPQDFWAAYQTHVLAWERFAAAEDRGEAALASGKESEMQTAVTELMAAESEISQTFDEVERIARLYGVDMPIPPGEARRTI